MNKCSDYLSGTDPVPNNTETLYDPYYLLPQENQKVLCKDEMADSHLKVKELTSNKETDYLSGTDSVPKNSATLADPSNVSPQIVVDIVDELILSDEIIYLGGTDSVPKNTVALDDPNHVLPRKKLKVLCKNEIDNDSCVKKSTSNLETGYSIATYSVPWNTVKLEDPSYVSPQVVADIEEIIYLGGPDFTSQNTEDSDYVSQQVDFGQADSVSQKTFTLKVPSYIPPQQVLTSDKETDYLSGTDSVPNNSVTLNDPYYVLPQENQKVLCKDEMVDSHLKVKELTSNKETDYLSGTDSVPKNSATLADPSYVSPQIEVDIVDQLNSNKEIIYLGGTDSMPQKTAMAEDCNYVPHKVDFGQADSVSQKTFTLKVPSYLPPQQVVTSDKEIDYLSGTDSVPKNKVALDDPSYVSPQVVADIVDQLVSNEEFRYLDGTDSVAQKIAMPEDRNTVQHQEAFDHADFVPQKTLAPKEDPNYVPPQQVFENEKTDIVDPRWETVKELTSNQERYEQVKACWGSSTVPDPDKNLTYHSFRRKKILRSGELKEKVKQHKRKASTTLTNETKRPCTYLVDKEINEIERKKEEKSREIQNEMNRVIDELKERHYHEEICYGNNMAFNYRTGGNSYYASTYQNTVLSNLRHEHDKEISFVRHKYHQKTIVECSSKFDPKLNDLENIRQEVLQFYTFYKGMGINVEKDPTVLTDFQLKVINDIENFYKQMKSFYK